MAFIKSVCPFYKLCIVNLSTIIGDRGSCGNLISFIQHLLTPTSQLTFEHKIRGKTGMGRGWLDSGFRPALASLVKRAKLIINSWFPLPTSGNLDL